MPPAIPHARAMTHSTTAKWRLLVVSAVTSIVGGACSPAYSFDFTCNTIEAGIVVVSASLAEASGGASVSRVFDVSEVEKSPGKLVCDGTAEWTDGRTTGLRMEARDNSEGGVDFSFQPSAEQTAIMPDAASPGAPSERTFPSVRTVDPSASDCSSIRPDVVELGREGQPEPELGALQAVVDFVEVTRTDERLDCEGRALWERNETRIKYGFHVEADGKGHLYAKTRFGVNPP